MSVHMRLARLGERSLEGALSFCCAGAAGLTSELDNEWVLLIVQRHLISTYLTTTFTR